MKNSDRFNHGDLLWDHKYKEKVVYDEERDKKVVNADEDRFERYKGQDEEVKPDRKSTTHYL